MDIINNIVDAEGEIIIRQGEALKLHHPCKISIKGTITAPGNWCLTKPNYDYSKAHVIADQTNGFITLKTHEHEAVGYVTVTGAIEDNVDLRLFNINKGGQSTYSSKQLASLLKMNRIFFSDRDENLQIVSNLEKFKARVIQEIEDGNDFKGNKRQLFEQSVKHDINLSFKLWIPVFKGEEKSLFLVDINFDITDGSARFWLESVELNELKKEMSDRIIAREVKRLSINIDTIIYL